MSLAAKLPFRHPYAAGFPGLGSQPMPTDADALDYLDRMAAADGASVEVGVATAVDAFFKDAKESGVFSALKACCILAGARTLAGALVPVVGTAPTNVANGFVSGDFSRTSGLTGDGTSYLNSNRDNSADGQNDQHLAVFATSPSSDGKVLAGRGTFTDATTIFRVAGNTTLYFRNRSGSSGGIADAGTSTGLYGSSRNAAEQFFVRANKDTQTALVASTGAISGDVYIFDSNGYGAGVETDATIAFYSIGTSLSLEDLDTAVSDLITAIGEAL